MQIATAAAIHINMLIGIPMMLNAVLGGVVVGPGVIFGSNTVGVVGAPMVLVSGLEMRTTSIPASVIVSCMALDSTTATVDVNWSGGTRTVVTTSTNDVARSRRVGDSY